jgi:tetratricopeptide (TPR) repeat protein
MTAANRLTAAVLLLAATGCLPHDDIRARYQLERMLWHAQFFERRVNISFHHASKGDMTRAVQAFQAVIAADPLSSAEARGWDPAVASDIRRLQMSARIALAHLYFLSERYADAATIYEETLQLGSMSLRDVVDARLGVARSLYMSGESSAVTEHCAQLFSEVVENPEFWAGGFEVDDVMLNIPVVLVRLYQQNGEAEAYERYSALAVDFYARVSGTWPGKRVDGQARLARVQLHMVREEWAEAAAAIEGIVADSTLAAGTGAGLELILGEIRAFPLADPVGAEPILKRLVERYPGTDAAYAARYDLAAIRLAQGDHDAATAGFRELERERGVPDAVASRAMFARAQLLESQGLWDDASALLHRLEQLYPDTAPAIQAPMVTVRHYLDSGEGALAERALEHAREYYVSLLDRRSRFNGDRLLVQGALAESYVMTGRAGEVAEVLASGEGAWDDRSAAVGMLRAAELYRVEMEDSTRAAEILKKVIERFPETRYARVAQHRLDEIGDSP